MVGFGGGGWDWAWFGGMVERGDRGCACAARRRVFGSVEVDVRAALAMLGLAGVVVEMFEVGVVVVSRLGGWSVQPGEMKT